MDFKNLARVRFDSLVNNNKSNWPAAAIQLNMLLCKLQWEYLLTIHFENRNFYTFSKREFLEGDIFIKLKTLVRSICIFIKNVLFVEIVIAKHVIWHVSV